ncbi:alpha/beta fold hydrolase [Nocardiopsis flavescens]|uniref:Pimeloyl-ACP methyl ester carboxylesterase n=1 Tax=Nocardiopsis flavescens TaxID=758803 RepID=A0A1M6BAY5_9ACTN|nr:alpha/beta fold hydrolase [Nocardiopsis flavescens]SHI45924.1 Pimeloyl-ACP methyl ester carboxylesterase [Nocardiopsis flavescens]
MRGIDVHYVDRGVGYPLLFVHGHPFDHTLWEPQVRALAGRGFRVIAPDLRGYGRSSVVPGATTMDDFARDQAALLEYLGLDAVGLVGASLGGQVALELCRLFPDRVDSLILSATDPHAETEQGRASRRAVAARLCAQGMRSYADEMLVGMMTAANVRALPAVADHVRAMMYAAPPEGAAAALRGRAERLDQLPLLRRISAPTLLVAGREDVFTPPGLAEAMHVRIPDSTVEIVEGAGHLPNLERPERFNEVLRRFLERSRTRLSRTGT